MIRRCIWRLSSGQALGRQHRTVAAQPSFFLSSRHEFSSSFPKKSTQKPAPEVETSRSTNNASKLILGSAVVGAAAAIVAYQTGYLKLHVKDDKSLLRNNNQEAVKATTDSKLTADKEILEPTDKEIFRSNEITSQQKPNAGNVETSETVNVDSKINTETSETLPIKEESAPYREEEISFSVENATTAPVQKASSSEGSTEELLSMDNSIRIVNSNQVGSIKTEGSMEQREDLVDSSLLHSKEADAKVSDPLQASRTEVQKKGRHLKLDIV